MELNKIAPAVGSVVIFTDCSVLAGLSSGSVKPKSAAVNVRAVSSVAVSVALVPAGASLTAVMVIVLVSVSASDVALPVRPGSTPVLPPSLVTIVSVTAPVALAAGTKLGWLAAVLR